MGVFGDYRNIMIDLQKLQIKFAMATFFVPWCMMFIASVFKLNMTAGDMTK